MRIRDIAAGAAITGALGLASVGVGAGGANAGPHDWWWDPVPPPGHVGHVVGVPPGHVGHVVGVPPGHIGHIVGVPPGHWDKPGKWWR